MTNTIWGVVIFGVVIVGILFQQLQENQKYHQAICSSEGYCTTNAQLCKEGYLERCR